MMRRLLIILSVALGSVAFADAPPASQPAKPIADADMKAALDLIGKMTTVATADGKDCDKLAADLTKVIADNKATVDRLDQLDGSGVKPTADQQQKLTDAMMKLMTPMAACQSSAKVQAVMESMSSKRSAKVAPASQPAVATGALGSADFKIMVDLMNKMTTVITADDGKCDKMADDLSKFIDDNKAPIGRMNVLKKQGVQPSQDQMNTLQPIMMKMMQPMMNCGQNPKMQQLSTKMNSI